jgi:hypothetical protein
LTSQDLVKYLLKFRSLSALLLQAAEEVAQFKDVVQANMTLHTKLTQMIESQAAVLPARVLQPSVFHITANNSSNPPYPTEEKPELVHDAFTPQGGKVKKSPVDVCVLYYETSGRIPAE